MIGGINQALFRTLSRNLKESTTQQGISLRRLASGSRFSGPGDDPVGQSFTTRLDAQIRGVQQAQLNVSSAQGFVNQADSTLQNLQDLAISLRELAIEASDSSLTSQERSLIDNQADDLLESFSQFVSSSSFDGQKLLDGSFGSRRVQTGPNSGDGFEFSLGDARSTVLGKLAIYSGAQGSITSALSGGDTALSINGVTINASSSDGFSTMFANQSGLAIANAINAQSANTGVTAEALATERTLYIDDFGGSYTGNLVAGDFQINGVNITGSITTNVALATNINLQSGTTGVTASVDGNGDITLIAEDGRNIELSIENDGSSNVYDVFNVSANNDTGLFASTVTVSTSLSNGSKDAAIGAIQIYSSDAIQVTGGSNISSALGFSGGNLALVAGTAIQNANFSTADGAAMAIKILDSTIADISTLRSNIGAVHGRLGFSAVSLVQSEEGLKETKSNFAGTDIANEISNLAFAQFLQDSTTAALTQANISLKKATELLEALDKGD